VTAAWRLKIAIFAHCILIVDSIETRPILTLLLLLLVMMMRRRRKKKKRMKELTLT